MRYLLLLSAFFALGCSSSDLRKQLLETQSELDNAKQELSSCSRELSVLKNTAENRLIRANQLLDKGELLPAKSEFQGIIDNFKGTQDAILASKEIEKINKTLIDSIKKSELKKELGFKILKPTSVVKFGDLTVRFEKLWIGKRWTFDDHGHEYFLKDAKRGNTHVLARLSISSGTTDPNLPPILVYSMDQGRLRLIGTMGYKFRRWKSYGSYLGNHSDYGNDFAHSKTIPFNCGVEISDDKINQGNTYIVLKKIGCFLRTYSKYSRPEISYEESNCPTKYELTVDDFDTDYVLLKIL